MPCSVDGCHKPVLAKTWCRSHYEAARRHGTPELRLTKRGAPMSFLMEALRTDVSGCIYWPFSKYRNGYGSVWHKGKLVGAHRLACRLAHGPAPEGAEAGHRCGNRACINPAHLRWVSAAENAADKVQHGRGNDGGANPAAKLTLRDVQDIRARAENGESHTSIARDYLVNRRAISAVISGETWRASYNSSNRKAA